MAILDISPPRLPFIPKQIENYKLEYFRECKLNCVKLQ